MGDRKRPVAWNGLRTAFEQIHRIKIVRIKGQSSKIHPLRRIGRPDQKLSHQSANLVLSLKHTTQQSKIFQILTLEIIYPFISAYRLSNDTLRIFVTYHIFYRLALRNQRFPVRVRLLAICRGELSAVIAQLMSKCLSSG